MRVQITQTEPTTLNRFQSAVGGLGYISGPRNQGGLGHKPVWVFKCGRFEHAQAIVAMLWQFLSAPKREDSQRALILVRDWQAEKSATCRKGLHRLAEVGLSPVGSCGECYRVSQRRRWGGSFPPCQRTPSPAGHPYEGDILYIVPSTGVRQV